MRYLRLFRLPTLSQEERGRKTVPGYPFGIFPLRGLCEIEFAPITIFYGGNGSGKSTLLNVIAGCLALPHGSPQNQPPEFDEYLRLCRFAMDCDDEGLTLEIPPGSRIITSEDIFGRITGVRRENITITKRRSRESGEWIACHSPSYQHVQFQSMDDLEKLKCQNQARRQTQAGFIRDRAGSLIDQHSNGETALLFFNNALESDRLYLLDEPENCLSPVFAQKVARLIEECALYCGCQFIISTHSPFLLSLENARIYDLDARPIDVKPWYRLENMQTYYRLFMAHRRDFEQ